MVLGDTLISALEVLGKGYRRYHRPIDSPQHLGSNRCIAADSAGQADGPLAAC
jgi:hypothetical protein